MKPEYFRARRIAAGYVSAQSLARKLGIHPSIVQGWEKGARPISPARQMQLAALLPGLRVDPGVRPQRVMHARCKDNDDPYLCSRCIQWDDTEIARLGELAGTMPIDEVTATLNSEFTCRPPRSRNAIIIRAGLLGFDLYLAGQLSLAQITGLFQYHAVGVVQRWFRTGLLPARRLSDKRGSLWLVSPDDLRQFIEQHSWAYDWTVMQPGPWRIQAEVVARRMRWRTLDELRRYLGYASPGFWYDNRDLVPHQRRFHRTMANAGTVMVRADDFPLIAEALRQRELQHMHTVIARRQTSKDKWQRTCSVCRLVMHGRHAKGAAPVECPRCEATFLTNIKFRGSRAKSTAA